jgi:8-oxo-dGTP pyrophosphatase MutT (NUDIX family)
MDVRITCGARSGAVVDRSTGSNSRYGCRGGGRLAGKEHWKARDGSVASQRARQQFAALPFRTKRVLEIMLVSSRETRRWILPKGWPIKGMKPHAVAALEALEEAGLLGKIGKRPIGSYHYIKRMPNGAALICDVEVFPLRVEKQRKNWPEREQRTTGWFEAREAASLVDEPELRDLILSFAEPPQADMASGGPPLLASAAS